MKEHCIGASNTAVGNVADDCDFEPLDMSFHLADRQSIDEGLRRMLVHTVAGVDNRRAAFFAQKMRRSGGRMPDDDDVRRHGLQVARRVKQRLAFRHAAGGCGEVQGVGAQSLLRQLERSARSSGRLEEEVDDGLAAQRGNFLDRSIRHLLQSIRCVQDELDILDGKLRYTQEVLVSKSCHANFGLQIAD